MWFDENFDIEIYRKFVERCLNFEKDGDWVETVSKWTFESHMFGHKYILKFIDDQTLDIFIGYIYNQYLREL